ncbi:DNA polymerase III subunit epsilon [Desulfosarcina widdelii]|uniref:DNA polymerase III subunit epsilon n=1 Tax=Desulfosarcina widdelii TaxID=947919 RepID=A0A5K7YY76_9BACT|nr:exonuclease domain-containing protein [Desulfosarcina widdelii]BBO73568.1 DNA polymerase III subunit epsilon [Desulfosarcina widdelii]
MKLNNKFWLFAAVCIAFTNAIAVILAVLFWRQISPFERQMLIRLFSEQFWYFFATGVFLFAAFGFTLDWFFRFYILPLIQMVEETRMMNTVNPAHRLKIDGSREIKELAELINACGDQYETAKHVIDQTVESAKAKTEAEKNILATIMAELTQGVLICDTVGRILLYNRQAQRVLDKAQRPEEDLEAENVEESALPEGFVGLHRSVYSLIDRNLIQYALKEIQRKLDRNKKNVSSHFVVVTQKRRQLLVETLPILDEDQRFAGFALIFSDITHQLKHTGQLNEHLKNMAKSLRSSIAAIRSTADLMVQFPDMAADQKNDFLGIISEQAEALSRVLRNELTETSIYAKSRWPLAPILVTDFVAALQDEALLLSDIDLEVAECDSRCMIRVDNYSLMLAIRFVLERLKKEFNQDCSRIRLTAPGNLVQVDLIWNGPPLKIETLRHWSSLPLTAPQEGLPLTLKEVLEHHHAEIWPHTDSQETGVGCLRLFIPMVQSERPSEDVRQVAQLLKKRPEFYDFDLFSRTGQAPELEKRLLGELTYTVFDTETTGLDPRGGDEIISIGAIRVVNGRLLHTETIHQLVDPCRPIPGESIKYHGITDQMVEGMPTVDKALAFLYRFARDTVLVAHNAAFDMRMLEMKEKATGIRFTNPVLDTMHLSAIVHPAHEDHSLDTIAQRLGVSLTKRHDALGDAIATGEVFLKIIPLLNEKGIYTLKDALVASQRTYYTRLKY